MLQLVYISSVVGSPDTLAILAASRRNNRRDGITGLLYADERRFMQVLEGPEAVVEEAYERIRRDPRHRAAVILSRRTVETREFGAWDMAERGWDEDGKAFVARVDAMLADAEAGVRATFEGLVRLRQAA